MSYASKIMPFVGENSAGHKSAYRAAQAVQTSNREEAQEIRPPFTAPAS